MVRRHTDAFVTVADSQASDAKVAKGCAIAGDAESFHRAVAILARGSLIRLAVCGADSRGVSVVPPASSLGGGVIGRG